MIGNMNTTNNQDIAIFFNFTPCLRNQSSLTGRYFARFQRAAKSAGQSAGGSGDNIIQSGSMRIVNLRVHAVMLCDFGMYAKQHGFILVGQIGPPQRAFYPFNFYFGCINDLIAHGVSFLIIQIEVVCSNFLSVSVVLVVVLVTRNRPASKSEDEDRCAEYEYET